MNHDFRGSPFIRGAYLLFAFGMPALSLAFRHAPDANYLHAMTLAALVSVFLAWPRAIHLDENGIWQRDRLGRRHSIEWGSLDTAAHAFEGKILIAGGNVEIWHTMFHAEPELLCQLIDQRTGFRFFGGAFEESTD